MVVIVGCDQTPSMTQGGLGRLRASQGVAMRLRFFGAPLVVFFLYLCLRRFGYRCLAGMGWQLWQRRRPGPAVGRPAGVMPNTLLTHSERGSSSDPPLSWDLNWNELKMSYNKKIGI